MTAQARETWKRQAVLYVVGELTAEESATFERQLAESQEAREALVSVMEKLSASWRVPSPPVGWRDQLRRRLRRDPPTRTRASAVPRWRGWSLALAACVGAVTTLAVLAGLDQLRSIARPPAVAPLAGPAAPGDTPGPVPVAAEENEDLAAVAYVDLTTAERVSQLQQHGNGQKNAARAVHAPPAHWPLLEFLSRPCPGNKAVGM